MNNWPMGISALPFPARPLALASSPLSHYAVPTEKEGGRGGRGEGRKLVKSLTNDAAGDRGK